MILQFLNARGLTQPNQIFSSDCSERHLNIAAMGIAALRAPTRLRRSGKLPSGVALPRNAMRRWGVKDEHFLFLPACHRCGDATPRQSQLREANSRERFRSRENAAHHFGLIRVKAGTENSSPRQRTVFCLPQTRSIVKIQHAIKKLENLSSQQEATCVSIPMCRVV
jgi:hypothetical protein